MLTEREMEDREMFGAPRIANGAIDFSAVHAMFNAAAKSGLKKPHFYAENGLYLSLAPAHGRNPGAIYVSQNRDYMGKIVDGVFKPAAICSNAVKGTLREIAADPKKYAISYGRKTGNCCICNRLLTNEESVKFGIGPICAAKFGFMFEAEDTTEEPTIEPASTIEGDSIVIADQRAFDHITLKYDTAVCRLNYVPNRDGDKFITFIRLKNGDAIMLQTHEDYEDAYQAHRDNLGMRNGVLIA